MRSSWNAGRRAVRQPSGLITQAEERVTLADAMGYAPHRTHDDRTISRPDYPTLFDDVADEDAKAERIKCALIKIDPSAQAEIRANLIKQFGPPTQRHTTPKRRRVRCLMCEDEGCWNCQ